MVIKSPEAFRTISEVANVLDVPPHVLRFWETRFTQVKPVKRGGGRRYYRPQDVQLLRGIRGLLYDDGLTIKGAQKVLREKGTRHVVDLGTVDDPETAVDAETMQDGASPADSHPVAAEAPDAPAPQQDLFNCPAEPSSGVEKPASHPTDSRKEKLKSVLRELEALRAVMLNDVT